MWTLSLATKSSYLELQDKIQKRLRDLHSSADPDGRLLPRARPHFITKPQAHHQEQIQRLIVRSFDPEITARPVYRLRSKKSALPSLDRVCVDSNGQITGSLQFYRVAFATPHQDAFEGLRNRMLILGPLAVAARDRGKGIAHKLIERGLHEARARGYGLCFVVGDPKLYRAHGFCNAFGQGFELTGQDDNRRFLVAELEKGVMPKVGASRISLVPATSALV